MIERRSCALHAPHRHITVAASHRHVSESSEVLSLATIQDCNAFKQTPTTRQKNLSCETGMCEINARGRCCCSRCAPLPPYFNVDRQHGQEVLQQQQRASISLGKTTLATSCKLNIEIRGSGEPPDTQTCREHVFRTHRYTVLL